MKKIKRPKWMIKKIKNKQIDYLIEEYSSVYTDVTLRQVYNYIIDLEEKLFRKEL